MIEINVVLYSYKNPNLVRIVEQLVSSTKRYLHVALMDQHPLNREQKFSHLPQVSYTHQFWDNIPGPTKFKQERVMDNTEVNAEYTLVLTDDTLIPEGLIDKCVDFIHGNKNVLVSGKGMKSAKLKDNHFTAFEEVRSDGFSLTRIIDRNFIFGYTETFLKAGYPTDVKYYGEEEVLSLKMYEEGIGVYSTPSDSYEDLGVRTIENLYSPFSKEHGYNSLIDQLNTDNGIAWMSDIGLADTPIKLFYQIDDVGYDPNALKMVDLGGERYIANTKAIY